MARFFSSFFVLAILVYFSLLPFRVESQTSDSIRNTWLNRFLTPASSFNKNRTWVLGSTTVVGWAGTMTGLYYLWYAGFPQSKMHSFNDNSEWMQIDKCGHLMSSYYMGLYGRDGLRWAGVNRPIYTWLGGSYGSIYFLTVELFDGISEDWGFSWGDIAANTLGTALFIGQELLWKEQRLTWKMSFAPTSFARIRPELLGSNLPENLLKDYNGQTHWLSVNIHSFLPEHSKFPRWLSIGAGYGASGMIGASSNPAFDKAGNPYPQISRFRQYYFTVDVDLWRIKTRSKVLKTIFSAIRCIKIPTPTIEINSTGKGQVKFYGLYPIF